MGLGLGGELRAGIGNGWVQLEDVQQQGYALEPGFSGAPIWDAQLQGVAGMAVAAQINRRSTLATTSVLFWTYSKRRSDKKVGKVRNR
ncbi:hypothetical protein HW132_11695 [Brasilonema sp. CT11]|nr:hypothetical protein [Brasilonema sp. CT11]